MKNKTEFVILNLNREKIFKEIVKDSKIYDSKIADGKISFKVDRKKCKNIEQLLDKKGAKVISKRNVGFWYFLKSSIFRIGVILPIIAFLMVYIFFSNFVFQIKIYGNEIISDQEVLEMIEGCGVGGITPKSAINTKVIEDKIMEMRAVSLVSVIIRGNTLVVGIKEKLNNEEYEDRDNFKPLCSEFNGIITEATIIQGTLKVAVGQTVKVGQELVAPYVQDTSGNILSVKPMAIIKADVFYTYTEDVPDIKIEEYDTGNVQISKKLVLGDLNVYTEPFSPTFSNYRTTVQEEYLTYNNLFPIKYIIYKYYETQAIQIEDYFNSNKNEIIEQVRQKTRLLVDEYDIIKEEYHTITSAVGLNRITYTVVANRYIC